MLIIGAGINGAVSAASLAARGVKVALIDRGDFAGETSSNSSNLAWGGIKYLQSHDYLLVDRLCRSRNRLMDAYPSTVREIRFIATVERGFKFPAPLIFMGTLLYWIMGRLRTRAPRWLSSSGVERTEPIINTVRSSGGVEYSDCYLHDNDARFVFNFVRGSLNYGCIAANYVEALSFNRIGAGWRTEVLDRESGDIFEIASKVMINACGPGADRINQITGQKTEYHHRFSKGIHLIVDRLTDTDRVLTFFASDGRLFFVIPMGPRSCIGTTDTPVQSPESAVTEEDRQFVLDNVNRMLDLEAPLTQSDIIAERCGVRPLAVVGDDDNEDWLQLSRKHVIEVNAADKYLTIFGGKLTDCLNVGDEVAAIVAGFGMRVPYPEQRWYGEAEVTVKAEFLHRAELLDLDALTSVSSSEPLSERLWRRYGRNAIHMLESIRRDPAEGELLIENAEYLRCEIRHAADREMITRLEDFLRRRSKIAQVVSPESIMGAPGLRDACEILFGEEAEQKLKEYIESM